MEEEMYSSWALLILTTLLIGALWTSYFLQLKKIRAVHETVLSIMAGMMVGLIIKLAPGTIIQDMVKFKHGFFFNLLLPPIILNSGYELKRRNFFLNFGTILTFAMAGTFIAAVVTGILTFLYTLLRPEGVSISFLDSMIFGSILSATDPVTILAIFNQLQVDPQLYSIISGESLLNDAVAIVLSEYCEKQMLKITLREFRGQELHLANIFRGIGLFMGVFWASTFIGVFFGVVVAILLKYSQLSRFPSIEACIVLLMAYSSYFFSNGTHMSGIVTLLFTGITLKHYAYDNLSMKSKRTTKSMFQILSQLSENFIFIYLGVNLFAQDNLEYKPFFILATFAFICIARYASVAPLSLLINAVSKAVGKPEQQLSRNHQAMLFWAGLRGAVAFALASGITGESAPAMRTTILAVVVLTVLIFGGTTSRMLQLLDIKTGVIEPSESDGSDLDFEDDVEYGINHSRKYIRLETDDDENSNQRQFGFYNNNGRRTRSRTYPNHDGNARSSSSNRNKGNSTSNGTDVSIGGLLSGPLGEPIPQDRPPHWFVSFDEKWLKPVLTKKNIQQRNQTLADYWREKRSRMERDNRNMLDDIRRMNFNECEEDDNDEVTMNNSRRRFSKSNDNEDDTADAVTLNSVKTENRLYRTNSASSTSAGREFPSNGLPRPNLSRNVDTAGGSNSRMIVGSGRVFGRSPTKDSDEE
ncbi:Sodium/hydrogen exchanger family-domain-containing protein [Mycotypha africana]|uniref:Sodium/hydrogen exchanger family-domain-containing protein n=1 Tax=Mycotypha africana TaxID=64632 RepID=UPI002301E73C|nr:Sodium/hydrogen exchanger family-domain-containing protein [Mycotypha africana]KAI8973466.1 Sodium/hydrogen exchanger family-domain-containing protein [Mycotypha africana]